VPSAESKRRWTTGSPTAWVAASSRRSGSGRFESRSRSECRSAYRALDLPGRKRAGRGREVVRSLDLQTQQGRHICPQCSSRASPITLPGGLRRTPGPSYHCNFAARPVPGPRGSKGPREDVAEEMELLAQRRNRLGIAGGQAHAPVWAATSARRPASRRDP